MTEKEIRKIKNLRDILVEKCVITRGGKLYSMFEGEFPELKEESEDEKTRKSLINLVTMSATQGEYALHKDEANNMVSWLEKQKSIASDINIWEHVVDTVLTEWNGVGQYHTSDSKRIAKVLFIKYGKIVQKVTEWTKEDIRLRDSCIAHIESELEEINKDRFGHSEIISDLKDSCRKRIEWLKSLGPKSNNSNE